MSPKAPRFRSACRPPRCGCCSEAASRTDCGLWRSHLAPATRWPVVCPELHPMTMTGGCAERSAKPWSGCPAAMSNCRTVGQGLIIGMRRVRRPVLSSPCPPVPADTCSAGGALRGGLVPGQLQRPPGLRGGRTPIHRPSNVVPKRETRSADRYTVSSTPEVTHFVKQSGRHANPRGLGHAWSLAGRRVARLWTVISRMADLPEKPSNIVLSGRFA